MKNLIKVWFKFSLFRIRPSIACASKMTENSALEPKFSNVIPPRARNVRIYDKPPQNLFLEFVYEGNLSLKLSIPKGMVWPPTRILRWRISIFVSYNFFSFRPTAENCDSCKLTRLIKIIVEISGLVFLTEAKNSRCRFEVELYSYGVFQKIRTGKSKGQMYYRYLQNRKDAKNWLNSTSKN